MTDAERTPRSELEAEAEPERDDVEEVPAEDILVETVEEHGWIEHDETAVKPDEP
ncbi:MAG: hypothetical protein M3395_11960 [Chloroflexota bacterium]|nr:hypothetical protein [Chloroflexota bacterium]